MLEASVSQRTELECGNLGVLAQRNNVGACTDKDGRLIRFGLMNDGRKTDQPRKTTVDVCKSSDWICVTPVRITPDMVGQVIGVYTALETKHSDWHLTPGDAHGQAQAAYHRLVINYGGRAGFVTCDADVRRITGLGL